LCEDPSDKNQEEEAKGPLTVAEAAKRKCVSIPTMPGVRTEQKNGGIEIFVILPRNSPGMH